MQGSESQNIEFKESWRDEYLKWICGFANAQGGKIFIGIADNNTVVGVDDAKRLMEDIPNKVVNYLGIVVGVNLHHKEDKDYIEVDVAPSNIPIAFKGAYHFRSGSTKQELKGVALQQFILKKMGKSWDDVENERASLDDIDRSAIDYFLKKAIASNRMPTESAEDDTCHILQNLNLMTDEGKLKNAAILLFGKNPSKFFTSTDFRIGRFVKDDNDLIFQDIVEGNIIQMADKVIELLRSKYLTSPISYNGLDRIEQLEIPEEALREAIFNSIIHKLYSGVHIQLKVYNDYLWLWNEGELPESITVESLMQPHTSHPRNRNIANIFYKAGFIESWGRGISKITSGFKQAGLKAPIFESKFGGMLVTMYRGSIEDGSVNGSVNGSANGSVNGSVNNLVKEIIAKNGGLRTHSILELVPNISERTLRRILKELSENNEIEFIGASKNGGYFIK